MGESLNELTNLLAHFTNIILSFFYIKQILIARLLIYFICLTQIQFKLNNNKEAKRMQRQPNVQKFVDKYFLPHFYHHLQKQHFSHRRNTSKTNHCNLCQKIGEAQGQSESKRRQIFLNQDDIDLLQLMDPKITPEAYMKNILKLYKNQENLHSRQQKNQPMQLSLTTRKIFTSFSQNKTEKRTTIDFAQLEEGIDDKEQTRQEELDRQQINRLRNQCFLGLGKMIVHKKQTQYSFELTKSNYHTRQYLLPRVQEEVERLAVQSTQKGEQKFYIVTNANSRGINFEVEKMPAQLSQFIQFGKFKQIICTLNQIIQQTVYEHRTQRSKSKKMHPFYYWQWLILFMIITAFIVNSLTMASQVLSILCIVVSVCFIVFILMINCHRFHEEIVYVSLIDKLNLKITDYLNYINSRPYANLQWKTSDHLYWIEITANQKFD